MADPPKLSNQAAARIEAIRAREELWFQRTIKRAEGRSQINLTLLMYVFRIFFAYAQEIIDAGIESDWPVGKVRRRVERMIEAIATEAFDSKHSDGGPVSAILAKPRFIKSTSDFIRASKEWEKLHETLLALAERQTAEVGEEIIETEPRHESDRLDATAETRNALLIAYKAKGKAKGIRITDEMVAKAASPGKWNDRTMVTWWKRNDYKCKPFQDRKIRAVLGRDPSSIWPTE